MRKSRGVVFVARTRFFRIASTSAAALAIAVPSIVITAGTAGAQTAAPAGQGCTPKVGTIISSKAVSKVSAWSPTNVSSSFVAGPADITRSKTKTSESSQSISASFELDEGLLFASAKETYGVTLQRSHSQSGTWTYTLIVPKGKTMRAQQYHQSWEIGVKQRYMGLLKGACHIYTEKSLTGNFFPDHSRAEKSFCWSRTSAKHSRIQIARLCHNTN